MLRCERGQAQALRAHSSMSAPSCKHAQAPCIPPPGTSEWLLRGLQGLAMQLVKLFLQEGSLLERGTIRWLLEHEPEVSYWYKMFAAASNETLLV